MIESTGHWSLSAWLRSLPNVHVEVEWEPDRLGAQSSGILTIVWWRLDSVRQIEREEKDLTVDAWTDTAYRQTPAGDKMTFFLTREAFRVMKTGARVINISSVAAQFGGSSRSIHYGAAKAALEAMTRGFAREGAGRRILVNAIRAGVIDTAFHDKFRKNMGPRVELIPLKRMGRAEDVSAMALFLAVDGRFTTGQVLCVTGGE